MQALQQFIDYFRTHPRTLFLIDGLGALLSAFLLGIVLVRLESIFGMPRQVLYYLAIAPVLFALYSLGCYLRLPHKWPLFLRAIALINLLYCGFTLSLVLYFHQLITSWGVAYFILEIIVVVGLSIVELKTASRKERG